MVTIANPLNLPYRMQCKGPDQIPLREAADPSLVRYRNRYWLFPSKSGGFWHSADLCNWEFRTTQILPIEDYAPDIRVIDDWLIFTASRKEKPCPVYRTQNPLADDWELVSESMACADPNLFQDKDGRVYIYHGCSNSHPLYGQELERNNLTPKGQQKELLAAKPSRRGWERQGENNTEMAAPWIEGAWMTRHNDRYYLQYSSPGTSLNVYSDGVFTAESPLGPFVCQNHNPFSFKPGGFITGAGHGSTFQDEFGNWWHISSMRVSVRHKFERRLGLWPAGFDQDGILFCNTRFGDWPMRIPKKTWNPWQDSFAGWMLLSYPKPVTFSSERRNCPAKYAVDENVRTFWASADEDKTPWLTVDLKCEAEIRALQINFSELNCQPGANQNTPSSHQYLIEGSTDGVNWRTIEDRRNNTQDTPHDYLELPEPCTARYIRLTIKQMSGGGTPAISGLRVFGLGPGEPPATPAQLRVDRDENDPCVASLKWPAAPDTVGYNLRWGTTPDKLYCDWLVYDQNELTLRCLNSEQKYWFAIEAFNENGVSQLCQPVST